ncbi:MAG: tRNA pseudouridine(38-40) synthase TruA [Bacteroidetes bacterium]|nr:MAG: tRNA pseudouridine(38-40) synthase TruA [Bacteroidota bacterium]
METNYFIEVAYKGSKYSGFQKQLNAATVQGEIEKALEMVCRTSFNFTGSSRTDAGVHAKQNYFHVVTPFTITEKHIYQANAVLPNDIVIKSVTPVTAEKHSRFDAVNRRYEYTITQLKNPFLTDSAFFIPVGIDWTLMQTAAAFVQTQTNFESFCKRNVQVFTYECTLYRSEWIQREPHVWVYHVQGNRFLRGMVRALVATMLRVGKQQMTLTEFAQVFEAKNCALADFSAPPQGLCLCEVNYPSGYFTSV